MTGLLIATAFLLGGALGYGIGCLQTEHWYRAHGWKP